MTTNQSRRITRTRRAFTLTELMVAVVVLLVIILAVGRIFGTASEVVKSGEANADILQEIASIEQLIRNDLDRISDEGFLLIQGIGVRNDVMASLGGGQLLDPTLPGGHIFRSDQLVFVASDLVVSRQTQAVGAFRETDDGLYTPIDGGVKGGPTPQSTASLVYYGHGVQYPFFPDSIGVAADVDPNYGIQPWFRPSPGQQRLDLQRWPDGAGVGGSYNGTQPQVENWALARQEILLADDYNGEDGQYMTSLVSADSRNAAADPFVERNDAGELIAFRFSDDLRAGRVDVATTDLGRLRDDLRETLELDGTRAIADAVLNYRPRSEKRPPTLRNSDVLLSTSVLAGNCSNFVIDWTWADGVGRELDLDLDPGSGIGGAMRGVSHRGGIRPTIGGENGNVISESAGRLPWFGFSDDNPGSGNPNTDVDYASAYLGGGFYDNDVRLHAPLAYHPGNQIFVGSPPAIDLFPDSGIESVFPQAISTIEGGGGPVVDQPFGADVPVYRYYAFFGLNGREPFVRDGAGRPLTVEGAGGRLWPLYRTDYTPWPSALRISATFHDAKGAIDGGRPVQFTIPLPRRVQDLSEE